MPDHLETRLRAERDRLDIDQPPLDVIAARAGMLRRRRRAARAGVAALALLAAGGIAVTVLRDGPHPGPAVAASDPAGVWSSEGITINGLPHLPAELPGGVRDVEFLDADRGFLLSDKCQGGSCTVWVSATTDGGRTWMARPVPDPLGTAPPDELPSMVVTGERITLVGAAPLYRQASSADGVTWSLSESPPTSHGVSALPGTAHLFLLRSGACEREVAAVVPPDLVRVEQQPPIDVCWAAPVRAGDGSWWVGGRTEGGRPALAVSRDGGATWGIREFAGVGQARAAMLGRDVYAVVVDPATSPPRLLGVAASSDGGDSFGPLRPTAGQATIGGDLVPLVDGRLLLVDGVGHWLTSADRGITWRRLEGLHPTSRLARTSGGYVAYELSEIYTAFSSDGATWQKLDAQ